LETKAALNAAKRVAFEATLEDTALLLKTGPIMTSNELLQDLKNVTIHEINTAKQAMVNAQQRLKLIDDLGDGKPGSWQPADRAILS
jgi:hypothetical protein